MLSSNMLLLILILLIEVTFSTPTPGYNSYVFRAYANVPRVFACRRRPA
jgi:hypothetical protein